MTLLKNSSWVKFNRDSPKCISVQVANDVFSFTVTGDVEGADNTVLGTALGALNNGNCVTDFVVIPNPVVAATGVAVTTDRFCGIGFVTVQSKYFSCNYAKMYQHLNRFCANLYVLIDRSLWFNLYDNPNAPNFSLPNSLRFLTAYEILIYFSNWKIFNDSLT